MKTLSVCYMKLHPSGNLHLSIENCKIKWIKIKFNELKFIMYYECKCIMYDES